MKTGSFAFHLAVLPRSRKLEISEFQENVGPFLQTPADYSRVAPKVLRNESHAKIGTVRSEALLFNTPYHTPE
jgi:hypothetical protein